MYLVIEFFFKQQLPISDSGRRADNRRVVDVGVLTGVLIADGMVDTVTDTHGVLEMPLLPLLVEKDLEEVLFQEIYFILFIPVVVTLTIMYYK